MKHVKYNNEIAPRIVSEARKRIVKAMETNGFIMPETTTIEQIEESSMEICSDLSYRMTEFFMKHNPSEVNVYAPIYSSLLSVLVAMELTNEWYNNKNVDSEDIYDHLINESPIDTLDEYVLDKLGIQYESTEYNKMMEFINKTYAENWIFMNEEAKKQGIGTQIMFVVDSLMIMFSIGILMQKKRLGVN